jgi:hypothetical protein
MSSWFELPGGVVDETDPPPGKPWRVTRYKAHWYWGYRVGPVLVANFRWYWQANLVSWAWFHVGGYSCNTWRYTGTTP